MAKSTYDPVGSSTGQGGFDASLSGDDAGGLSSAVQSDVSRLKDEAGRQGAAALDSLKQGAQSLTDRARDSVADYAEDGKHVVTQQLDTFAQAIRSASDELSKGDQTLASQLVRQAASGLESLSRSVDGANLGDMLDSVRRFGRRNPAAFIGGAVLAGLALGRFVRSSGSSGYGGSEGDWQRFDGDRERFASGDGDFPTGQPTWDDASDWRQPSGQGGSRSTTQGDF